MLALAPPPWATKRSANPAHAAGERITLTPSTTTPGRRPGRLPDATTGDEVEEPDHWRDLDRGGGHPECGVTAQRQDGEHGEQELDVPEPELHGDREERDEGEASSTRRRPSSQMQPRSIAVQAHMNRRRHERVNGASTWARGGGYR